LSHPCERSGAANRRGRVSDFELDSRELDDVSRQRGERAAGFVAVAQIRRAIAAAIFARNSSHSAAERSRATDARASGISQRRWNSLRQRPMHSAVSPNQEMWSRCTVNCTRSPFRMTSAISFGYRPSDRSISSR
jgi:hypothetical protein